MAITLQLSRALKQRTRRIEISSNSITCVNAWMKKERRVCFSCD